MNMKFFSIPTDISELCCYIGCILSLVIAKNLLWMGKNRKLTFVNKMLILYYILDFLSGITEVYYLFKLKKERY